MKWRHFIEGDGTPDDRLRLFLFGVVFAVIGFPLALRLVAYLWP